jgi:hypothetical protein
MEVADVLRPPRKQRMGELETYLLCLNDPGEIFLTIVKPLSAEEDPFVGFSFVMAIESQTQECNTVVVAANEENEKVPPRKALCLSLFFSSVHRVYYVGALVTITGNCIMSFAFLDLSRH